MFGLAWSRYLKELRSLECLECLGWVSDPLHLRRGCQVKFHFRLFLFLFDQACRLFRLTLMEFLGLPLTPTGILGGHYNKVPLGLSSSAEHRPKLHWKEGQDAWAPFDEASGWSLKQTADFGWMTSFHVTGLPYHDLPLLPFRPHDLHGPWTRLRLAELGKNRLWA